MKKLLMPLFILGITVLSLFGITKVSAAEYKSTLNMPANSNHIGSYRWYDTKNFIIDISMDAHTDCTSNREKLLWVTLHYSPTTQVSGKMMSTELYQCVRANMGKFKNGQYAYGFSTNYTGGRQFCGIKSNSVIMTQN